MNLHCVGNSNRLGGFPLMYLGTVPLSRGMDSKSPFV